MSDQRIPISQLAETQTAPDASYIAIDDGSLTKKITVENFNSTSTASAQQYASQAAASAQTVENNIATSAAQIREATLAAREATQASTSATASATSAYDSASLAQNYSANASTSAGQAMNAADSSAQNLTASKGYAEDSEAWAAGKRNGSDVPDSDETYQNNAKYYANNASGSATRAEAAAQSITVPDTTLTVSGVAADSKATGDRISSVNAELADVRVKADGTTATTAGDAVREQVTELKSAITYSRRFGESRIDTGYKNLNGNFVNGAYDINTWDVITNKYFYRVINNDFMHYSEDITIVAADGFRFYPVYYTAEGAFVRTLEWKTGPFVIPSGKYFRIQIARVTENTSEIADVSEFVGKIGIETTISKTLKSLQSRINTELTETKQLVLEETVADESQDYLKELYLTGVQYDDEIQIGQVARNYHAGVGTESPYYYSVLTLETASDNPTRIAQFYEYSFTDPFVYTNHYMVVQLKAYNSSGVNGYAVVNLLALTEGQRIYPHIKVNVKKAMKLENCPIIREYLNNKASVPNIVVLNKEIEPAVIQATKGRAKTFGDTYSTLAFLHFSDVHKSQAAWGRIVDYIDYYQSYLSFAIHSGDYVANNQADYIDLYADKKPTTVPIFNAVGNHDVLNASMEKAAQATTYGICFPTSAAVSDWGVTFGSADNSMYYYKDFPSSNVRLIVIDEYYFDTAQALWLEGVLNSARSAGLSVITVAHEWSNNITNKISTFNSLDEWETTSWAGKTPYNRPFTTYIKSFKDAGGKHIIHICGHWHFDNFGFDSNGILNYTIPTAKADELWTDSKRVEGTKTFDCFNVMSVNTEMGIIKIVRIGNNTDNHLQPQNVICYDYVNQQLVSNW